METITKTTSHGLLLAGNDPDSEKILKEVMPESGFYYEYDAVNCNYFLPCIPALHQIFEDALVVYLDNFYCTYYMIISFEK